MNRRSDLDVYVVHASPYKQRLPRCLATRTSVPWRGWLEKAAIATSVAEVIDEPR